MRSKRSTALLFALLSTFALAQSDDSATSVSLTGQLETQLETLEANTGAYSPMLMETIGSLAAQHAREGNHEQALTLYERQRLLQRANEGLYSLNQIDTVRAIIASQKALNDWEAVHNNKLHLLWLHRRNYPAGSPELLPALRDARNWHINAFGVDTGWDLTRHYRASQDLYEEGIELIQANGGSRRDALCFWHSECCREDANPARQRACPKELLAQ